jgi:hypothetical protein
MISILLNFRELYPKLIEETGDGKLCVVNTPEPLSLHRELKIYATVTEARLSRNRKVSVEERHRSGPDEMDDIEKDAAVLSELKHKEGFTGIRQVPRAPEQFGPQLPSKSHLGVARLIVLLTFLSGRKLFTTWGTFPPMSK